MILCNVLLDQFLAFNVIWRKQDFLCSEGCARQVSRSHPKQPWLPQTEASPHVWCRNIEPLASLFSPRCLLLTWVLIGGVATRRRIPKHTRRWKSALVRARKISRLAQNLTSARTTRMLAVTGMLPSATYASKLLGMAPSQLDRFRTATVNALMPRKGGRCRTTTLAIAMGQSEPGISVGVELIRSWLTW